jgi:hypothetical protein
MTPPQSEIETADSPLIQREIRSVFSSGSTGYLTFYIPRHYGHQLGLEPGDKVIVEKDLNKRFILVKKLDLSNL